MGRFPQVVQAGQRWCPLCDELIDQRVCPAHALPSINAASLEASPEPIEADATLGQRYQLQGLLGQGGMAKIFLALDQVSKHQVVVKIPLSEGPRRVGLIRRLYREAASVRGLEHPHIVRLLDLGVDEALHQPYLVLEALPGVTLSAWLRRHGPMAERPLLVLTQTLLSALGHAHERGVLHRDLTPSNVMIAEAGPGAGVWLLDFGLARPLQAADGPPLTAPGATVGTPSFMSPEQITGGAVDGQSDLYALGCVLYYAATGQPPYAEVGPQPLAIMEAQLSRAPPELPAQLSDGRAPSAALRGLLGALLKKSRLERPQDSRSVLSAYRDSEGNTLAGLHPGRRPDDQGPESPTAVLPRPLDAADATSATRLPIGAHPESAVGPLPRIYAAGVALLLLLGLVLAGLYAALPSPRAPETATQLPTPHRREAVRPRPDADPKAPLVEVTPHPEAALAPGTPPVDTASVAPPSPSRPRRRPAPEPRSVKAPKPPPPEELKIPLW